MSPVGRGSGHGIRAQVQRSLVPLQCKSIGSGMVETVLRDMGSERCCRANCSFQERSLCSPPEFHLRMRRSPEGKVRIPLPPPYRRRIRLQRECNLSFPDYSGKFPYHTASRSQKHSIVRNVRVGMACMTGVHREAENSLDCIQFVKLHPLSPRRSPVPKICTKTGCSKVGMPP